MSNFKEYELCCAGAVLSLYELTPLCYNEVLSFENVSGSHSVVLQLSISMCYLSEIMARIITRLNEVGSIGATKFERINAVNVFYKTIELICCLDFGYFKHKSIKKRIIWKSFTLFRAICIITAFLIQIDYGSKGIDGQSPINWSLYQLSNYLLTVIVLICFNPNKTFCQFHHDLKLIDRKFNTNVVFSKIDNKLILWNVFVVVSNIIQNYIFCSHHNHVCSYMSWIPRTIYFSCHASLSVVYVSKSFLFYCLTCRLNCLLSMLKSENDDVKSMKYFYKNIVEVAESYKAAFDPLFFLAIVFKTVEYMVYILRIVREITDQNVDIQFFLLLGVSGMISFFAPSLFAEWTASQQEKIKLVLQDKLFYENDERRQRQLKQFLWYMESRGLRFRVYKLIPLDANLLTTVLKFIVTYVIVIVQFMYK